MTPEALAGLTGVNVLYLLVGTTLLWGLGALETWGATIRLAGLGYVLGVASLGILWTIAVVVGAPFGTVTIVVSALAVAGAGVAWGRLRGREPPAGPVRLARVSVVAAAGIALAGVFFEALFRAARLHGLFSFDGWVFWVPKGKALYFFGGLDEQIFTSLPGPTYPPLVPLLDASAFHAMGGSDTVTLHVQYWFLALGFAAALAGMLAATVPPWLVWPPLLLVLVAPRLADSLLSAQADFLVDYFFALAAASIALWLIDDARWRPPVAAILLAAAVMTKREGALLAGCLVLAALLATARDRRRAWPRLFAITAAVVLVALPWRIWYATHGIGGEVPAEAGLSHGLGRLADALRLSLDVLFDIGLWSVVPLVGIAAIAIALLGGTRRVGVLAAALLSLVTLGGAWITFSYPELPLTATESANPIVRYTGSAVLLCAALTPLLLAGVWSRTKSRPGEPSG